MRILVGHDAPNHRQRFSIVPLITLVLEMLLSVALVTATPAQEVKPFAIHVEDAVQADLQERLAKTRWPDQIPGSEWTYGVNPAYMRELTEYWRTPSRGQGNFGGVSVLWTST